MPIPIDIDVRLLDLSGDLRAGPRHLLRAGLRPEGERGADVDPGTGKSAGSHDLVR